ncbi:MULTISPECIES: TolC family protein [Psychrilyobacter]|nr:MULTISPECIES: TolC family protein [Psychrilyobacter]MCS5420352.1 TolC family protein [Psychrilyobacter sp. S5]NDI78066.1 TolC family protein [Psychrilyobacter piezotolerans]
MKKIISLMLILMVSSLWGAEKMTLNESLETAYENNYEYQNIKIDKENIDLQVREGYKSAAPALDYRGGYTATGDENKMSMTDGSKSDQRLNHELGITQPIYNGGTVIAGIEIAKISQELTTYKLAKSKSQLKLGVIDAYLKILAQAEVIVVYETSLEEVKAAFEKAERKYQLDLISKSDYLPLKTQVISTGTDLVEAQNQGEIYMIEFKNIIGMPMDRDIDLENLEFQKYDLDLIDIDADINYALLNNKDSRISKLNTDIVEKQEKISRADLLPQINGRLAYKAEDRHLSDSMDNWYWTAGIEVNWRLFDFGKSWDAYTRSKNETRKAGNIERKTLDDLEVNIRTNYIDLVKLNGTTEAKEAELEAAQENYDLQKRKYNEGIISITDYLIYETQLNNTKLSLIKTKLDYYYAYEKYLEDLK